MSHKFDLANFDEFILNEKLQYVLPDNIGLFSGTSANIQNDISLFKIDMQVNTEELILTSSSQTSGLFINITLEDKMVYKNSKNSYSLDKGDILTTLSGFSTNTYKFNNTKNIKNLCIVIKDEFLNRYLLNHLENKFQLEKDTQIDLRKGMANYKLQTLANELYNSPFEGELNSLYLQSKVLEFIYYEFSNIIKNQNTKYDFEDILSCNKLNIDDIAALYKAKELIEKGDKFYNLNELCRKVALNEFKLKFGFKKLFNTTPGQMILNLKMEKAKELLLSQQYNVQEVSRIIGYKYQQNFSNAFIKHFNINPKSLIKSKNYYDFK
ncbi:helix-turn-helix domain-containing protein [Aliarcobacter lanthieri]|uniref:helix-turn-helix domain-containing protein n=1 Tax=Aliarcobacter lanthieri TaxID=1355374 RepID=UPI000479CD00|nr:helix-turn-helix transcriptional regulator [Aliarcobacter lanthieri]QKF60023.1 transcriptional regulator, AraC family [Aliarcobacter lanthieri]